MAADAVHRYMKVQNRPYSVNDIVLNLHNKYGKSAVQKAVDDLVAGGKVFEKVYGKQKVYCIVQETRHDADELMRIDKQLQIHANEIESKYQDLEREIKSQEAVLSNLKSSVSTEQARGEKSMLLESVNALTNKLDELMEATATEDLSESKRKAENSLSQYSKEYSKRKRLCTEIIDCILENYPGSKSNLYDEIGIEPKVL